MCQKTQKGQIVIRSETVNKEGKRDKLRLLPVLLNYMPKMGSPLDRQTE